MTAKTANRFWAKVHITDECWEWQGAKQRKGYGKFNVVGGPRWKLAHRVAWEITYGPIPEGLFVCHHCDNPSCVRPDHLFLGTRSDNARDMVSKGRNPNFRGRHNPRAKLTESQVIEARARYAAGQVTIAQLATDYGLGHSAMSDAISGRNWKNVQSRLERR